MTLQHPWVLWFLAIPLFWAVWEWRRSSRHAAVVLKAAVFALVFLALAQPRLPVSETKVFVTLLADSSASIPPAQMEQQRRTIEEIAALRGRNQVQVLSFDEATRRGLPQQPSSAAEGTNLEVALRNALAASPPGFVPRVALFSDGNDNLGSVERAIYQARELGTPVDTFVLAGRERPGLQLLSVAAPTQAFAGERFPIEIVLAAPEAVSATVELTAEGSVIGRSKADLRTGENTIRAHARLQTEGATLLEGKVRSASFPEARFEKTITLTRPRALLLSGDPSESDRHLRQVLAEAGFETDRSAGALPASLRRYHLVIANNQDLEKWPEAEKKRVEDFVRAGGGFLLVAGENNLYAEDGGGREEDPLERMLPAKLAPPRTPEGAVVILVLDKSSSMEGNKIALARRSAIGVVDNLRPFDHVGVLVFDNSFQWAVSPQRNREPEQIKQSIAGIIADGGTQIAPALFEAYQRIRERPAVYKHILLLTDGISEEGDSIALAREAANNGVTISTIGLGQDVNRSYLERVAATAQGQSYLLSEIAGLEQLVLRDVMEHTGSSITEKPVRPKIVSDVEILDGVGLEQAGPLLGWVKFTAKPAAETILAVDDDSQDPLLARWQYGLGRAAVFASDAKDRWAVDWLTWPGFDRFWSNVTRDLLPRAPAAEASVHYERSSGDLVVRYELSPAASENLPSSLPNLYVLGPSDFRRVVPLASLGALAYEARVPIEHRYGLFRIRAESDLEYFPETAFYRPSPEWDEYGSNPRLLEKIAEATGGRFRPQPQEVFDSAGRSAARSMHLWPGLLALAILLNLVELAARKGWLPWLEA